MVDRLTQLNRELEDAREDLDHERYLVRGVNSILLGVFLLAVGSTLASIALELNNAGPWISGTMILFYIVAQVVYVPIMAELLPEVHTAKQRVKNVERRVQDNLLEPMETKNEVLTKQRCPKCNYYLGTGR